MSREGQALAPHRRSRFHRAQVRPKPSSSLSARSSTAARTRPI